MSKEISAQNIVEQAEWRASEADEHPVDIRNQWAADGLRKLAAYVRGLPESDERIVELS